MKNKPVITTSILNAVEFTFYPVAIDTPLTVKGVECLKVYTNSPDSRAYISKRRMKIIVTESLRRLNCRSGMWIDTSMIHVNTTAKTLNEFRLKDIRGL